MRHLNVFLFVFFAFSFSASAQGQEVDYVFLHSAEVILQDLPEGVIYDPLKDPYSKIVEHEGRKIFLRVTYPGKSTYASSEYELKTFSLDRRKVSISITIAGEEVVWEKEIAYFPFSKSKSYYLSLYVPDSTKVLPKFAGKDVKK